MAPIDGYHPLVDLLCGLFDFGDLRRLPSPWYGSSTAGIAVGIDELPGD